MAICINFVQYNNLNVIFFVKLTLFRFFVRLNFIYLCSQINTHNKCYEKNAPRSATRDTRYPWKRTQNRSYQSFKNEARNLREFVNNAEINFNVDKGTLRYKPENINLPFNNISIRLKDKKTILNDPDAASIYAEELENYNNEIFSAEPKSSKQIIAKLISKKLLIQVYLISKKLTNSLKIKIFK